MESDKIQKNVNKAEVDSSTDDVFYSLSSAVSDATLSASDQARSPTPSTVTASSTSGTKSKALSRLKALRPKKLMAKKVKPGESSSDTTPESSTALLKTEEEKNSQTKESKIPRKSRTSNLVRKLTFSSKRHKVSPKTGSMDDEATTSSNTTPQSEKRAAPTDTSVLSISESSLCEIQEHSHEDSSMDSQNERKKSLESGSSGTKQELKIKILGKKVEKMKQKYEGNSSTKKSSSASTSKVSSSTTASTKNTVAATTLPSPPPTPPQIIHIPLKVDTKPISVSKSTAVQDQITSNSESIMNKKSSTATEQTGQLTRQQQNYPTNIVDAIKKESLKTKLLDKLNLSGKSLHDHSPTVRAPAVPYNISELEIANILSATGTSDTSEQIENTEIPEFISIESDSKSLSPEKYQEFIKKDRDDSLSEATSEKIFTLVDTKEVFMKRSDRDLDELAKSDNGKKRSKKQESSDSKSVHVQEPQQPYQKQLSSSKVDVAAAENTDSLKPENPKSEINFRIGTAVRPITTVTPNTGSISIDSAGHKSHEEISSLSSESQSPPTSESSRRRIKYIPQPTLFLPEEQTLLEGNFGPPSSYISDYSIDYSLNPLSMTEGPEAQGGVNIASSTTMPQEKREHLYKILVIGELGTGKTSFIKRYVHNFFSQNYRATIGVDFALKVLNWDENTIIRLQLWDIAGQERFGNMTRVYYKEAVGAFIVFDVTRPTTFDAVIKWKEDLDSKVQLPDGSSIPCILLANKCDQPKQGLVTSAHRMDDYCKEHGFSGWFETSAKETINIEEAAKSLVNKILLHDVNAHESNDDGFTLDGPQNGTSNKKCAC